MGTLQFILVELGGGGEGRVYGALHEILTCFKTDQVLWIFPLNFILYGNFFYLISDQLSKI